MGVSGNLWIVVKGVKTLVVYLADRAVGGAPLAPPQHTQHRVLVVSAPAPTRSRLFPAGDSVCLPGARGAQPIGVAQVMFTPVGLL